MICLYANDGGYFIAYKDRYGRRIERKISYALYLDYLDYYEARVRRYYGNVTHYFEA